jgi:hypothetical protein
MRSNPPLSQGFPDDQHPALNDPTSSRWGAAKPPSDARCDAEAWRRDGRLPPELLYRCEQSQPSVIPPGNYHAVIAGMRRDYVKESGNRYILLDVEILHGPFKGRCLNYYLWVTPGGSRRAMAIAAKFGYFTFQQMCAMNLVGRTCSVFVDRKRDGSGTEIKDFSPMDLPKQKEVEDPEIED